MLHICVRKQLESFSLSLEFNVPPGITALFGHSGAGKSMTMACVAGLSTPDSGRITLGERVLFDAQTGVSLPPQKRSVGYVMQDYLLFPHLSVAQNVAFGLMGMSKKEKAGRVQSALVQVGLEGLANRMPADLSGGQQQRVALARALVTRPQILLLDEPFSALDGPTREQLRRDVYRLQRRLKVPALFVTHDLAEAYLLADQIAVIEAGRLLQLGSPAAVVNQPVNRQVAELTGGRNFYRGRVIGQNEQATRVQVGAVVLTAPSFPVAAGQIVTVAIRGERIMLVRKNMPVASRQNTVHGRIVSEMTDGFNYKLFVCLPEGARFRHPKAPHDLEISLPAYVYQRLDVAHDKEWDVTIKREAIHIFSPGL